MGKALGLVETVGLIGAIEAADAGLKSANVSLIDKELSTGGFVTVKFEGDVGAVKAAVEAASVAAQKVSELISAHVIARTSDELEKIKYDDEAKDGKTKEVVVKVTDVQEGESNGEQGLEKIETQQVLMFRNKEYRIHEPGGIDQLKVVDLRNIARNIEVTTISKQEIKFAKKEELLSAIIGHFKRGEE
jgi:microcompartment protein CcmL/EutN